jgi:hypothetical protein
LAPVILAVPKGRDEVVREVRNGWVDGRIGAGDVIVFGFKQWQTDATRPPCSLVSVCFSSMLNSTHWHILQIEIERSENIQYSMQLSEKRPAAITNNASTLQRKLVLSGRLTPFTAVLKFEIECHLEAEMNYTYL